MSDLNEQLRAEFEARYGSKDAITWRRDDGSYKIPSLQSAWEVWRAATEFARRSPASPAVQPPADLHAQIMNIKCNVNNCTLTGASADLSYKQGHRDARHAAAELAAAVAASTVPAAPAVGIVKRDKSSGLTFIDWNQDHTTFPVGFKLYAGQPPAQPALQADAGADAARDVLAERRRQVEVEGWTPERDDTYRGGQMAVAAGFYALASGYPHERDIGRGNVPAYWPWAPEWWKPRTKRENLVRAGALILAEIERIDRSALTSADEVKP